MSVYLKIRNKGHIPFAFFICYILGVSSRSSDACSEMGDVCLVVSVCTFTITVSVCACLWLCAIYSMYPLTFFVALTELLLP